jgi:hypothetical protein
MMMEETQANGQIPTPTNDTVETVAENVPVNDGINATAPKEEESDAQRNFKALREAKNRVERERDEAVKLIQDLQKQTMGKQQSAKSLTEENELMLNPDDLVEGKHLSYFQKKIKDLEKQVRQNQQVSSEATVEMKLKSQYADFDKVVSKDNVELLREVAPELAQSINSNPDLYSKAKAAYLMIKKMGIYQEDKFVADKNKAHDNMAKPKPLAAVSPQQGESPLSRANAFAHGLTEDLKAQLRKEMTEARKNL